MPKQVLTENPEIGKQTTNEVVVLNLSETTIEWDCDNYSGNGTGMRFILLPKIEERLDRNYARATLGDWTIDKTSKVGMQKWAGMISNLILRSPSCDGIIPWVKITEMDGTLLWDAPAQWEEFQAKYATQKGMLAGMTPPAPCGHVPMPKVLEKANQKELAILWHQAFRCKMPLGMTNDDAKKCIMPKLTEPQMREVLAEALSPTPAK